jgi:hypothetical protein
VWFVFSRHADCRKRSDKNLKYLTGFCRQRSDRFSMNSTNNNGGQQLVLAQPALGGVVGNNGAGSTGEYDMSAMEAELEELASDTTQLADGFDDWSKASTSDKTIAKRVERATEQNATGVFGRLSFDKQATERDELWRRLSKLGVHPLALFAAMGMDVTTHPFDCQRWSQILPIMAAYSKNASADATCLQKRQNNSRIIERGYREKERREQARKAVEARRAQKKRIKLEEEQMRRRLERSRVVQVDYAEEEEAEWCPSGSDGD